ncbi:helix-turn-helix domain-containing protein [Chryseobacterium sp. KBW03]|uniref:helix-turn-helix domain-containing protein n=1 Tax=Chryseobacterium sp. KBW03 TaxID=2153362 RepID=UPI0016263990|nr:helix-turn-helix domain-containing protein [Chryseobacterium sp. KBW03]
MAKFLLSFLLCLLINFSLNGQARTIPNKEYIDAQLEELRFNTKVSDVEKEKVLFSLKSESEKIGYRWGILKSGRRIIEIYEKQNKNKEVIKLATELEKIDAGPEADRTMANLYRSKALALGYVGLDEASLKDFKTAVSYAKKITDSDIRNYTLSLSYSNMTIYFLNKRLENATYKDSIIAYTKKSIEAAQLINGNNKEITLEKKFDMISFSYTRLGITDLEEANKPGKLQSAEKYLTQSLNIVNKYNLEADDKVLLMNQLSWLYLEKKEYQKTIEYANLARDLEKRFPNPTNRVESFEFLASAYTEMGDSKNAKIYMDQYTYLKDSIRITEKNNTDYSSNILLQDSKKTQEKTSSIKIIIISALSLVALLFITFYWKKKNKIAHKKYEDLIAKIHHEKQISHDEPVPEAYNEVNKSNASVTITDETARALLLKLKKFESSGKYLRKDLSLTWMANSLNTNTKYLSEVVKVYRERNFTSYINELRISYIVKKLYENPIYREYKITYLAEECGYATPRVFVNAFKKETGFTPSYFVEQLKVSAQQPVYS